MEEADYQKIAEAVNGYLSLFQSEELVQGQQEGESQGMGVQTGKLPVISLLKSSEPYLV